MEGSILKAAALTLALLVGSTPLIVAAQPAGGSSETLVTIRAWAALNETVRIAEKSGMNISLYKDRIEKAHKLMERAVELEREGNLPAALRTAARAFELVKPLLVEVEMPAPAGPGAGLERAERILEHMRKMGVPVPEDAIEAIREAAMHKGDWDEYKIKLRERIAFSMHKSRTVIMSASMLGVAAVKLAHAINITIDELDRASMILESGGAVNETVIVLLVGSQHRLEGLSEAYDRLADAAEMWGVDESVVRTLENVSDSLEEASDLIEESVDKLEDGNINASLQLIANARSILVYVVNEVSNLTMLPKPAMAPLWMIMVKVDVHKTVAIWKHEWGRHGMGMGHGHRHGPPWRWNEANATMIEDLVDKIKDMVEYAYEAYREGVIPPQMAKAMIRQAIGNLETLKNMLPENAPEDLVDTIEETIEWAQGILSQIP